MVHYVRYAVALILLAAAAGQGRQAHAALDAATHGDWIGVYGSQGYILNAYNAGGNGNYLGTASASNDTSVLPSYVSSYTYGAGAQQYVWSTGDSATTTKDLQDPSDPTGLRNAATAFNGGDWSLTLNLNQSEHFQLAVYALDYDNFNGRDITISVDGQSQRIDGSNGYLTGAYAVFNINASAGPLEIDIHQNASGASNSTISGIFFDKVSAPEPASLVVWGVVIVGGLAAAGRRRKA